MAINNYSKYNSSTYPMSGQDDPVYQFATKSELYHELRKEATLRHNHPALQDAWEKYQMLLALVKE
jgi:hypothetical protein